MHQLHTALKAKGVKVEDEVRPAWGAQGYGQQCKLWDPEGNTIELRCYTTPSYTNQGGHDMALTLAEANRMMQAARAKAEELHVKVSVAVCDAGGNLLAFNRMEGASAVSATVAQGKAAASAGFGRPSGALAADSPVIQSIIATLGGAHAAGPGGRADLQDWRTGRGYRRQWRDGSTG
jgi:glc operon protein GlcG